MKKELYGKTRDGKDVFLYTVENKNGMEMSVMNFGAILVKVVVPDKDGNIVCGHQPRDGERVVVVDDVLTTGITLDEKISELKKLADVYINNYNELELM